MSVRERLALSMLRAASDLTHQRRAVVTHLLDLPGGLRRDRAVTDLAIGSWTEKALLWVGFRLLPSTAPVEHTSAP